MYTPLKLFLFTSLSCYLSSACLIDYSATKVLTINDTGSYYGYSVLLQKGNPPTAIVGAPRKKHNGERTGSLYNCNLNSLKCREYNKISREKGIVVETHNNSGHFLGSVLDGDASAGGKIFTCAPRFIVTPDTGNYFTIGRCFYVKNSFNLNDYAQLLLPLNTFAQVSSVMNIPYYDAAFGESGLSLAYLQDQEELVIGAPGMALWNGALVRTKISNSRSTLLYLQPDFVNFHDNYFGYAVGWGRFIKRSPTIWYVSGAPRGHGLKGQVTFFVQTNVVKGNLYGEEFGSYFGASLLVIHNKGGGDDILVGAPMYSGKSWDEGRVYYYRNKNDGTFYPPITLSRKIPKSRFGSVIADTGDIDLDSFSDCAISAPYEDDGVGAVYIYFGIKEGFSNDKFHRISPSNFATVYPRTVIRGFGMGISRGNDMDNKKHNDIAIGAYKSGQIFYFKSFRAIDVEANVRTNMETLYTSTTNFSISFCLKFTYRNGEKSQESFSTYLTLVDNRVVNEQNITETVALGAGKLMCNTYIVYLKKNNLNIEPLRIHYGYKRYKTNSSREDILDVPISYECGSDNVCQTNLGVTAETGGIREKIIIGLNNELQVNVEIRNSGESAYQTKLYLTIPPEISLITLRECDFVNGSYVCMVAQMLNGTVQRTFLLDLTNLLPNRTNLPIRFKVDSIGEDVDPTDNEFTLQVPTELQNNPYIDSRSTPDSIFLNKSKIFFEINHLFLVGNQGPSPLHLNVNILVPVLGINGSDTLIIQSVEGVINGIANECSYSNEHLLNIISTKRILVPQINNTKSLSCFEPQMNCTNIVCNMGYFPKSSENAIFTLKIIVNANSLAKFTKSENKLTITSAAYYTNGTNEFFASASTLIYGISDNSVIPLWIFITAILLGLVVLLLLIYTLYKCNFFKRTYRDKLENEQNQEHQQFIEEKASDSEDL